MSVPTQMNTRSKRITMQPHPTLKQTNPPTVQLPMVQPTHRPQQQSHGRATPHQPGSSTLNPDTTRHPDANNLHQLMMKREKRHPTRVTSIQKGKFKQTKRVRTLTANPHGFSIADRFESEPLLPALMLSL